jgi:predicted NACHT family NTPase
MKCQYFDSKVSSILQNEKQSSDEESLGLREHLLIKTLKYESEKTVYILDHQFFTTFFEQSYGFMILLGEAGMGKSIALSNIAQKLSAEAKNNIQKPVPIILYCADWAMKPLSFEDWLKSNK